MLEALALFLAMPAEAERTNAETKALIPLPPLRFRGNNDAAITFVTPTELFKACKQKVEVGQTLLGCALSFPRQIWLLNPCLALDQLWATEACHELGHVNGWSEDHEE